MLKTKFTELQKAFRRADVLASSSMIDVVYFAFGHVSAPDATEVSFSDALRRTVEVFEFKIKYDRPAALLSSVTSECGTWRSLPCKRGDDITILRASLHTSKNEFELPEGQIAVISKEKEAAVFEQDASNAKVDCLHAFSGHYRDACSHVAKRMCDEGVHFGSGSCGGYK